MTRVNHFETRKTKLMEDASGGEFAVGEPGVTSWNVVQSK
jgi:hypothetical protein